MGAIGVLIALGGPWVLPFFIGSHDSESAQAVVIGTQLLWLAAGYQFFDGLNLGSSMCLRGAGDVRIPAALVLTVSLLLFVPLAHAFTFASGQGWVLLAASLVVSWLLATPVVADWLQRAAERSPPLDLTRPVAAEALVILGGGDERVAAPEYGGAPAPGPLLLERVAYGAFVAHRTALPVLVSGTAQEALAMRTALARDFGVEVRWVEGRSRDTFENAQFSAPLLKAAGVSRVILVTDGAHAWRAAHEFAGTGLAVVPAPVGLWAPRETGMQRYLPSTAALDRSRSALYELLGDR